MKYFGGGIILICGLLLAPNLVLAKKSAAPSIYRVPVLVYHEVQPIAPTMSETKQRLSITPETFVLQLQYLATHKYRTIYWRDLVRLIKAHKKISPRTVVLTFDDGTRDFYTTVLPLLQKYKMRATLFANPGKDGVEDRMSLAELKLVGESGWVEVGAHTLNHTDLTTLTEPEARDEIVGSKQALEYLFGTPVVSFAYPYGAYNFKIAELVKESGFIGAVIANTSTSSTPAALFWWPRHTIGEPEKLTEFIKILRAP